MILDAETIARIERTLPLMRKNAQQIAIELYRNIFRKAPSVKGLFSLEFLDAKGTCPLQHVGVQLSTQAQLLSDSIIQFAVVAAKGDLSTFEHALARICAKHVSRGVQEAHFTIVLMAFDEAMRSCVGAKLTGEDVAAWRAAVAALAVELMKRERALAKRVARAPSSWRGFRAFSVAKSLFSASDNTAHLVPVDKQPVAEYTSGQFVCVRLSTDDFGDVHCNAPLAARRSIEAPFNDGQLRAYDVVLPSRYSETSGTVKPTGVVTSADVIAKNASLGSIIHISPPLGGFMLQKGSVGKSRQSPLATCRARESPIAAYELRSSSRSTKDARQSPYVAHKLDQYPESTQMSQQTRSAAVGTIQSSFQPYEPQRLSTEGRAITNTARVSPLVDHRIDKEANDQRDADY